MLIKPGYKYRIHIQPRNIHNGIIHILGIVKVNSSTPDVVVARWQKGRQKWHIHTMSTLLLNNYHQSGWLTDLGPTEHDVRWGRAQLDPGAGLPHFLDS